MTLWFWMSTFISGCQREGIMGNSEGFGANQKRKFLYFVYLLNDNVDQIMLKI